LIFLTIFTCLLDVLLQEYEEFRARSVGELTKINPMMMTRQFQDDGILDRTFESERRCVDDLECWARIRWQVGPGYLFCSCRCVLARVRCTCHSIEIPSSISDRCRSAKR